MKVSKNAVKAVMTIFCLTQLTILEKSVSADNLQNPVLVQEKAVCAPINTNVGDITQSSGSAAPPLAPSIAKKGLSKNQSDKNQSDNIASAGKSPAAPNTVLSQSDYPLITKMEVITFGQTKQNNAIEERLSALEQEVFHTTYKDQSLFDRTDKLKLTILGPDMMQDETLDFAANSMTVPLIHSPLEINPNNYIDQRMTYFELVAENPENQVAVDLKELPKYALELVNKAREQVNSPLLNEDKIAVSMAEKQITDLHKRKLVSHTNEHGENPDLRYTRLGGNGAIVESVVAFKGKNVKDSLYTKATIARILKQLIDRQDDRDSLLSQDATGFGFAITALPEQGKAIACIEVSTSHGAMESLSLLDKVGDKVEINGYVEEPYKFAKITIAWEGSSNETPNGADEVDEALPYFPPLDYIGYKHKGEHDYSTATTALKMGCLVAVIAGGVFMPPVALAAPLILMSPGGNGEPKPMSDIPLHGGVKLEGNSFSGKVTVSNNNKPGIYYITVWATFGKNPKPIPVSRRAYVLTEKDGEVDKHS